MASVRPPANREASRRSTASSANARALASTRPTTAMRFTTRRVSRWIGVSSPPMFSSALPMRPRALRSPVAKHSTARGTPRHQCPREHCAMSLPAGPGTMPTANGHACLRTGADSPVSRDSSTARFEDSRRSMSAGTRSPSASSTMSPLTTSRPATRVSARPEQPGHAGSTDRARPPTNALCDVAARRRCPSRQRQSQAA